MNTIPLSPKDIAAVICTMNSVSGIERCLQSLRDAGVGEVVVVDANSTDGTREIAEKFADQILTDPGTGLGRARNIGIQATSKTLILNMGSDNVMPAGELEKMIDALINGDYQGVSAQTRIEGQDYASQGLNAWRTGRFRPGRVDVIGTPTLFRGELLRAHPYDPERRFSDDSELCERWTSEFGARFAISDAYVFEIGKTSWTEIAVRCRMYGVSDEEVYSHGVQQGWSISRRIKSITHPTKVDLFEPLIRLDLKDAVKAAPFLAAFTTLRYMAWGSTAFKKKLGRDGN